MATTKDEVHTALIKLVKSTVGDQLATIETTAGTQPAVIQEMQKGLRPSFPYVLVEDTNNNYLEGWIIDKHIIEDELGNYLGLKYVYQYSASFRIRFCGNESSSIANDFKQYICFDRHMAQFYSDADSASILVDTSGNDAPIQIPNEFSDDTVITVLVNFYQEKIDADEHYFDSVRVENSELKKHVDDENPIDFPIIEELDN